MADDLMFDCDAIKSDTSVDSHANQSVDSADSPLDREDDKNVNSELLENDSSSSNHSALESDFLPIEGNSASSLVEKLVKPAEEMRDENAAARIVGTKTKNKTKKTDVVSKIDSGVKSRSAKAVSKESTILKEEKKTVAVKKSPSLTGTKKVNKTANKTLKDTKSKAAPATKLPAEEQVVKKPVPVKTKTANSASKPISSSQNTARSTSASRPISAKSASSSKPTPKKPVSPKPNTSTSASAVGAVSTSTPSPKSTSATKTTFTKPSSTKLTSLTKAKLQKKPSTATSSSPQKGIPTKPSTSRSPSAAKPTSSKLDAPISSSAPKPVSAKPNPTKSAPTATSTKPNTVRSTSAAKKSSPETKPERSKSATRATPSRAATGSKLEKSTPATKITPSRTTIGSKPERSTSATRKTPSRPTTGSKSISPRPNNTKPGVKSKSASSAASTSKTKSTSEKLPSPKAKSNPSSAKNVSARPVKKTQEASKEKPAASPRIRKKITPPKSDKSKYDDIEKGKELGIGITPPQLGNENKNQELPCPFIAGSNESPAIDEVERSIDSLETKPLVTSDTVKEHANIEPSDEIHTGTSSERISENDSDSIKTDSILSESDVRNEPRGLEGEARGECDKDSEETNNSMNRDLNQDMDDRTEDHEVLSPEFNQNVKRKIRDDTTTDEYQDSAGISDEIHVEIEDHLSFEASKDSRMEISGDISLELSGENCNDAAYMEYKQENTKKTEKDTDLVMNPKTEVEIVNAADVIFHETTIKDNCNSEVHPENEDRMEDAEGLLASHDPEHTIEKGTALKECFERGDEQEKNSTSDICKSQKDVIEESVEVRQDLESKTENDMGISTGQEGERNKETGSVNEEGDSNMNTLGENVLKNESNEMIDVCFQGSNKHDETMETYQQGETEIEDSFLNTEIVDKIDSSFDASPIIEIERKNDPALNTPQDVGDEKENDLIVVECLDSIQGINEESKEGQESYPESHLIQGAAVESENDSSFDLYNNSEERNKDDRKMNEETKSDGTFKVSQDVIDTTENPIALDGYQKDNEQSDPALDVSQDISALNKIDENLNANQEATNTNDDSLIIGGYQKAENQSKVGLSLYVSQEEEGKNGYNLILDGDKEGGDANESIFQTDEEKNEALEETEKSIQDLEPNMENETTENLVPSSDARNSLLNDNEPDEMAAIFKSQNDRADIEEHRVKNYDDAILDGHHSDKTPPSTPIENDFTTTEMTPDCLPDVSFIGASFFQPQDQMNQCDNDLWMSVASTNPSKYNEGLNVLEMCEQDLGQTKEYVSPLDLFENEQMNFSDLDTPMSDVAVCNGEDYQDLSSTDDEGTSGVAYFHDNFQSDSPGTSGAVTKNHGEVLVIEDETARVSNFSESEKFFPMSHNIGQSDIDSAPYENSSETSWDTPHQLDSNTEGGWNNHQVYMISQGGGNFSQSYGLAHSVTQLPFVTKDKNNGDPV